MALMGVRMSCDMLKRKLDLAASASFARCIAAIALRSDSLARLNSMRITNTTIRKGTIIVMAAIKRLSLT